MNRITTTAALAALLAASATQAQERQRPPGGGSGRDQSAAPTASTQPSATQTPVQTPRDASGSFQSSCRNTTTSNGRVFSECRGPQGVYRRSSIEYGKCVGDIGNQNGILACNGATAQDGGIVAETPTTSRSVNGRNDSRSSNGGRDVGGLLGGLLGANGGSGAYNNGYTQNGYGQSSASGGSYDRDGSDRGRYNQGYADPGGYPSQGGGYRQGSSNQGGYPAQGPGYGRSPETGRSGYDRDEYSQGGYANGGGQGGYGQRSYNDGYGQNGGRGRPALVLYDGFNFTGRAFEVYGDVDDLQDERFNDRARSVKVYSGRWKLCREAGQNRCEHVSRDVPDLRAINAADQISSVERE